MGNRLQGPQWTWELSSEAVLGLQVGDDSALGKVRVMVTRKWPHSGYILEVIPKDIDNCLELELRVRYG